MESMMSTIKNIVSQFVEEYIGTPEAEVNQKIESSSLLVDIEVAVRSNIEKFATIKKLKDPDAPKRPTTSYLAFYKEKAAAIKQEFDLSNAPSISKKAGELWRELSEKEKKKYEKIAQQDKERYEEEKKEYRRPSEEEISRKISETKEMKKLKDPHAPKKPKSAYIYFSIKNRTQVKEETGATSIGEISKELGSRWRSMDEAQKAEYIEMQKEDKERYDNEIQSYEKPSIEELKELAKKPKPKRKAVSRKTSETGIKKPRTAYIFFCIENRERIKEENPELKSTEIMKQLGAEWKQLDDEHKEKYIEMATNDKERYNQETENDGNEIERKVPSRKTSKSDSDEDEEQEEKTKKVKKVKKSKKSDEEQDEEQEEKTKKVKKVKKSKKSDEEQEQEEKTKKVKKVKKSKKSDDEEEEKALVVSFELPKKKINLMNEDDFGDYSE